MRLVRMMLFFGMLGGFASGFAHLAHGPHGSPCHPPGSPKEAAAP